MRGLGEAGMTMVSLRLINGQYLVQVCLIIEAFVL